MSPHTTRSAPATGRGRLRAIGAAGLAAVVLLGAVPASAATPTSRRAAVGAKADPSKKAAPKARAARPSTVRSTAKVSAARAAAPEAAPASTAPSTAAPRPTVRSKKLVIYSGRTERLVAPLFESFTFTTGIEVEVRYADTSQLAATLLEEGDRTKAAIFFSQDAGALGALAKAGMLAPLPKRLLDRVDRRYRAVDDRWVGVSGRARVFAYDTRQVTTPPSKVEELLQPRWARKIGYAPTNASWHAFVTALRVSLGEQRARRWLTEFRANGPRAYASNGAIVQAVNQGEIALGLVNHYYLYERMAADGASRVFARNAYPDAGDPGALVNVAGVGVLQRAADDAAALEFVEYLLSRDAQRYFAERTFEYPLVSGVATHPDLPALASLRGPDVDLSDLDSLAQTLALLREVGLA